MTDKLTGTEVEGTIIKVPSKTRTVAPGRTRVVVSLTDKHLAKLQQMSIDESSVFPRAINEFLSILIEKNFEALTGGDE